MKRNDILMKGIIEDIFDDILKFKTKTQVILNRFGNGLEISLLANITGLTVETVEEILSNTGRQV